MRSSYIYNNVFLFSEKTIRSIKAVNKTKIVKQKMINVVKWFIFLYIASVEGVIKSRGFFLV